MILDYPTLRVIWWLLLGALLMGFAIMDGFDLGVGMLLHRVAKNETERRITINTIGPVWEGNQIWLVLGGGAIFAAWPTLYSVSFSGFYFAMLLLLLALILRPVGFKYRSKINDPRWRQIWDIALFLGGFLPALLCGVAVGNVLQGVPFYFDENLRAFYTGNLIGLLNPFGLMCGIISVVMLAMQGGSYLAIKTEATVQQRAITYARACAALVIILFALAGMWIIHIQGYVIDGTLAYDGPSNPLYKHVSLQLGAWLNNYTVYPIFLAAPIAGFAGALLNLIFLTIRYYHLAFICSSLSIAGIIATVGVSMFPFILPSSTHPTASLLVWDASSSQSTLLIMLVATIIFLPIIVLYTSWVYYVLRGKVTANYIQENSNDVY